MAIYDSASAPRRDDVNTRRIPRTEHFRALSLEIAASQSRFAAACYAEIRRSARLYIWPG
jgi:hypothetical protein